MQFCQFFSFLLQAVTSSEGRFLIANHGGADVNVSIIAIRRLCQHWITSRSNLCHSLLTPSPSLSSLPSSSTSPSLHWAPLTKRGCRFLSYSSLFISRAVREGDFNFLHVIQSKENFTQKPHLLMLEICMKPMAPKICFTIKSNRAHSRFVSFFMEHLSLLFFHEIYLFVIPKIWNYLQHCVHANGANSTNFRTRFYRDGFSTAHLHFSSWRHYCVAFFPIGFGTVLKWKRNVPQSVLPVSANGLLGDLELTGKRPSHTFAE